MIAVSLGKATINTAGPAQPELVLMHPRDAEYSAKACISLTIATIQNSQNSIKQTNIDVLIHHVVIHTRGKAPWMQQVGEILKSPAGVNTTC